MANSDRAHKSLCIQWGTRYSLDGDTWFAGFNTHAIGFFPNGFEIDTS